MAWSRYIIYLSFLDTKSAKIVISFTLERVSRSVVLWAKKARAQITDLVVKMNSSDVSL